MMVCMQLSYISILIDVRYITTKIPLEVTKMRDTFEDNCLSFKNIYLNDNVNSVKAANIRTF